MIISCHPDNGRLVVHKLSHTILSSSCRNKNNTWNKWINKWKKKKKKINIVIMSFVVTMRRTLPIRIFLAQVKMELSWKKNEIMKIVIMIMINKCHFNDCYKIQIYFIMQVGLLKLHIYNSHAGCALPYCWYFCQWGLDVQLIIIIKKKKKKKSWMLVCSVHLVHACLHAQNIRPRWGGLPTY